MSKILITGGAGFIGSNLSAHLSRDAKYEIVVMDLKDRDDTKINSQKNINYIQGDIRDIGALRGALSDVEVVVHLAAETRVIDSVDNPIHNFNVNVAGSFGLLNSAKEAGVSKFINASTGGAILGDAVSPVNEMMPASPLSPYGASKLAVEGYCSAFSASYGMQCVSLRFSNVYGPNSHHKSSVIAHFFKQILDGKDLTIYGDGTQKRDYIYVDDLVKGIKKAIDLDVSGVFQLGTGLPTSLNELISLIIDSVGSEMAPGVIHEKFRLGEVHTTYCDIEKAREELKFNPQIMIAEGTQLTWSWFQKYYVRQ